MTETGPKPPHPPRADQDAPLDGPALRPARAPDPGPAEPDPSAVFESPYGDYEGLHSGAPAGQPAGGGSEPGPGDALRAGLAGEGAPAPEGPADAPHRDGVPAHDLEGLACVVLAAGQGTRMRSATPKVLHEIGGRAMLHHVLAVCSQFDPAVMVTVVGRDSDAVAEAAEGFAPTVRTVVQDPPLGTGHAVMAARPVLKDHRGDVLVMYADTPLIRPETLVAMREARARGNAVVALGFTPDDPTGYGRLISGRDGALHAIVEAKDATPDQLAVTLCNAGVMLIDGAMLFALLDKIGNDNVKQEYYLTDIVALARQQNLKAQAVEGDPEEVLGVNSRDQLALAEAVFQTRRRAEVMAGGVTLLDPFTAYFAWDTVIGEDVTVGQNVVFGPGVVVEAGAEIKAFSHIEGARIGRGAVVGPFARIRPGTELGARVRVGNFVETKQAKVGAGAKINHLSYMGDVVIGPEANIGAGAITCNYDGFDKFETRIGAGAFVGTNASLVAPVTVGEGAYTGAGSVITRNVSPNALAVTRPAQKEHEDWAARFRDRKLTAKVNAAE